MDRLYYLTDEQFEPINRLLPPEAGRRGRPPTVKNREALEGVLHVLRTGTPWRDLPNAYGPWAHDLHALATLDRAWGLGGDPEAAAAAQGRRPDHRVSGFPRGARASACGGRR